MRKRRITALKAARDIKGWSQRDAAGECKINPGTFHRIEQGELGVSPATAHKIAHEFKMPVSALFTPSWYAAKTKLEEFEAKAS